MPTPPFNPVTYPVPRRGDSGPENSNTGGSVTSVFGRTGAVVAVLGDYTSSLVSNASTVPGATVSDALDWLSTNAVTAPIDLTGANVTVGPANTFLSSNGVSNAWLPVFNAPANPGDDGKVVVASAGNFTYLGSGTVGQALLWSGTAWAASTNFGAQNLTTTGGFIGNSGTSFVRLGLASGSGAGVASAASAGNIRGARGVLGFTANVRNNADTGDLNIIKTDTAASVPYVMIGGFNAGDLSGVVSAPAAGVAKMTAGVTCELQLSTTSLTMAGATIIQFANNVVAPTFTQAVNGVLNGIGNKLSLFGQPCTGGGTSVGGDLDVGPGRGITGGLGRLVGDDNTKPQRLAWNVTGLSFFTAAPVAQQTPTGSRAGNAALASLLTALALTGLIVDGTSA